MQRRAEGRVEIGAVGPRDAAQLYEVINGYKLAAFFRHRDSLLFREWCVFIIGLLYGVCQHKT